MGFREGGCLKRLSSLTAGGASCGICMEDGAGFSSAGVIGSVGFTIVCGRRSIYGNFPQAAEKQVSQLRKDRDAAEARVGGVERSLERLGYDESQADGLAQEKEAEEKAVDSLREVRVAMVTARVL